MIDTGINLDHTALKGSDIEQLAFGPVDRPSSDRRHGTAIAALLVGTQDGRAPGLLPGARLIAVDPFHDAGRSDTRAEAYDLVRSLDMLIGRAVAIINLSLAGPDNAVVADAVAKALERGVMLVAAAGNDGPRSKPLYPAAYEGVIAVTALDQRHAIYRRAVRGEHIDFAAPGVGIWAAASVRGWKRKTGTSFATPFVTAALALAMAQGTSARGTLPMQTLSRTAKDLGAPGRDPVFGWGLVQAAALCRIP
jgi:subtilisin family serine protease